MTTGTGTENTDVFDVEEEAERAVAAMVPLVAPWLLPFPATVRKSLLARVAARVADITVRSSDGTVTLIEAKVTAPGAPPVAALVAPSPQGRVVQPADLHQNPVPASPAPSPPTPAHRRVRPRPRTIKEEIVAYLSVEPGTTVSRVAAAVYGADDVLGPNKARALLHQMAGEGRARLVPRLRGRRAWEAVPPEEQDAARAAHAEQTGALYIPPRDRREEVLADRGQDTASANRMAKARATRRGR